MKARLLARRGTAPMSDPGVGRVEFEFAHLLDSVSLLGAVVVPRAVAELVPDEPDVVPNVAADVGAVLVPDAVSVLVPDVVPDVVAVLVPDVVAVSRFANAGLDDDRLPIAVKRHRRRR